VRDQIICSAAVAVVLGCLLTGCQASHPAAGPVVPRGQLTPAQATQVFAGWLGSYKSASFPYSATEVDRLTTGLARQINTLTRDPLSLGTATITDERVIVPLQAGYPRWFLGTATEPGPPFSTYVYFVLTQAARGGPWQAATILSQQGGTSPAVSLAEIAIDREGYASQVPLDDSALAVPPDQLSADYARLFNGGVRTAEVNSLFPPGDLVFYIDSLKTSLQGGRQHGWIDSATESAAGPAYALRLTGGGAAVLFPSTLKVRYLAAHSTVLKINLKNAFTPHCVPQPPYIVGRGVPIKAGVQLTLTSLLQLIVLDRPRGSLPVKVVMADQAGLAFSPATEAALRSAGSGR
jgi:hypothetical protein